MGLRWEERVGVCARGVAVVLGVLALLGCDGDDPCPTPVSLSDWCRDTGRCTDDNGMAPCVVGARSIRVETLTIPLDDFAYELVDRRDVAWTFLFRGMGSAEPDDLSAGLDGVPGTWLPAILDFTDGGAGWDPYPSAPTTLTISNNGTAPARAFQLDLICHDCESANATPDEPL